MENTGYIPPKFLPPQVQANSDPGAQPLGYFGMGSKSMPKRAIETLRLHSRPSGDIGDWPLDDAHVAQFQNTIKLRKKLLNASRLYYLLDILVAIGFACTLISGFMVPTRTRAINVPMLCVAGLCLGLCILYYVVALATSRAARWAPLIMFILFIASFVLNIAEIATSNGRFLETEVPAIIGIIFAAAFAYVSWIAYAAIPDYLAQPAWCQELAILTAS